MLNGSKIDVETSCLFFFECWILKTKKKGKTVDNIASIQTQKTPGFPLTSYSVAQGGRPRRMNPTGDHKINWICSTDL